MKHWMLFRRERDNAYFFFDGYMPIGLGAMPRPQFIDLDKSIEDSVERITKAGEAIEKRLPQLKEVNNSPKKLRGFVIDKVRYHIDQRGVFLDENA